MSFDFTKWKEDISSHKRNLVLSLFLILSGAALVFASGFYTERKGVAQPGDLILDHIPALDLSILVVWLFLAVFFVYIFYPVIFNPKKVHYMLGIYGVFLFIKSGFAILTHLAAPAEAIAFSYSPFFYDWFNFSNALFFSGQVGLAFLGYLVYNNKKIKMFMLVSSIVLAVSLLFMHRHYSIDVLSAYFITCGIYKMGDFMFADEKK